MREKMKLKDILSPSFKDYLKPVEPMVAVEWDSDLCQKVVSNGWLSEEQMHHAAERYRLGKSKSGRTIYWMIDETNQVRDGHLGDTWVSSLLKAREPKLLRSWHPIHCLFGLHLLGHTDLTDLTDSFGLAESAEIAEILSVGSVESVCENKLVCVVESEASAVVLSELFPESIWMAYAYPANMIIDLLEPLQGCTVTIYPPTDPNMEIYLSFIDFADTVRRIYPSIDITIERILEDNATEEQKQRNIDLVDFLFEGHTDATDSTDINPSNPRNPCSCQIQGEFSLQTP